MMELVSSSASKRSRYAFAISLLPSRMIVTGAASRAAAKSSSSYTFGHRDPSLPERRDVSTRSLATARRPLDAERGRTDDALVGGHDEVHAAAPRPRDGGRMRIRRVRISGCHRAR